MADKRLSQALHNLVSRGELTQEDAHKVEIEFDRTTDDDGSKRKILSEVGGYLGGIFILISLLILFSQSWRHISRITQFSLFLLAAFLLFVGAKITGKSTNSRARLAGLLGAVSSFCLTMSIIVIRANSNELITLALLAGWLTAYFSFILFRTILGELSLAGYSIALAFSGANSLFPHLNNYSPVVSLILGAIGATWLYLANTDFFNRGFGDAVAMAMLFVSGQMLYGGNLRFLTYLICIAIAVAASWLYARAPEWPLLVGGIAAITVGTGEFVGDTLGGSLGAALGLLTSGIFFVIGSIYSLKRSKGEIPRVTEQP
ncbi:MAG: hypothetical protein WCO95_00200 [Actinomycetes bacterium]|jgi:Predicted membrane protein (DUF2157)